MSRFSYFAPYVPVAKRRANGATASKKLMKDGKVLQPISIEGRKISTTFWGTAWCDNLESYSDYENRLPRGKTYARNGSVLHLEVSKGHIEALVQGSGLYKIQVDITPLAKEPWAELKTTCTGKITNLLDLLQGRLPKDLLATITAKQTGMFPKPSEIRMRCSCPDSAGLCKHIASVMYGVGNRLDQQPELFFILRSVEMQELITDAGKHATDLPAAHQSEFGGDDLADIFGIEMESTPVMPAPAKAAIAKKVPKKAAPAKKATAAKKTTAKKAAAKKKQPTVPVKKAPAVKKRG